MPLIEFYYFDKFRNRKVAAKVDKRDFELMKTLLLEDSCTVDIGDIYYVDENGVERCLDYYND